MSIEDCPISQNTLIRCRKLGHEVKFSYCSIEREGLPCLNILNCWNHFGDLTHWLASQVGESLYSEYTCPKPKAKVLSLVELIEKFKKEKS